MTSRSKKHDATLGPEQQAQADGISGDDGISPLPGEAGIPDVAAPSKPPLSRKGLLAVALLLGSLIALGVLSAQRVSASFKKTNASDVALTRDKPTAASAEPHKLDLGASPPRPDLPDRPASAPRIPALIPTEDELAEPIGVRRTGAGAPGPSGSPGQAGQTGQKLLLPEDAPVLLLSSHPGSLTASNGSSSPSHLGATAPDEDAGTNPADPRDRMAATSRNLQDYQKRLQGLMASLTQTAALATNPAGGQPSAGAPLVGNALMTSPQANSAFASTGLFGGQLQRSATPRVMAAMLGNRSLTLPKGTAFTCALKTKVISAASGLVGCEVQRNVYGDDGRVLLIERGSHLDGEYRIASVKPGTVRIPVLWTRVRTPFGVTVDLDSPGTGQLGESGVDGYVDNRWSERIGAAMLLSLIDDSVQLVIQSQTPANADRQGNTVVLPSTTANTSKLAEKVLDSTINIPPLVYQNQGGIVGIYVARDIDFSSVYELQPTTVDPAQDSASGAAR